jgi:amidohydrolase
MLLGAAALLVQRPPARGHVKLLFQPAEEGGGGAARMIDDGALEGPSVEAIYALHVDPRVPTGRTGRRRRTGERGGRHDRDRGRRAGGHAAYPHLSVDAVAVAAQVVTALQHVVSRHTDPLLPLVVTIGTIHGGFASNVIAPSVTMQGTVRSFDPGLRERMPALIERVVQGVVAAHGATARVDYVRGYPATVNDARCCPSSRRPPRP